MLYIFRFQQVILQLNTQHSRTLSQFSNSNKRQERDRNNEYFRKTHYLVGTSITSILGYYYLGKACAFFVMTLIYIPKLVASDRRKYAYSEQAKQQDEQCTKAGEFQAGLPSYSMKDVAKHSTK